MPTSFLERPHHLTDTSSCSDCFPWGIGSSSKIKHQGADAKARTTARQGKQQMSVRGTKTDWEAGKDSQKEMDKRKIVKKSKSKGSGCKSKGKGRRSGSLNSRDKNTERP